MKEFEDYANLFFVLELISYPKFQILIYPPPGGVLSAKIITVVLRKVNEGKKSKFWAGYRVGKTAERWT